VSSTLVTRARSLAAGLVLGATAAAVPWAVFAMPFVLLARAEARHARALVGLGTGYALLAALGVATGAPVSLAASATQAGTGVGLCNVFVYFGAEGTRLARALAWLLPSLVLALSAGLAWRRRAAIEPFAASSAALLAGAVAAGRFSAFDLAAPLVLLVIAGARPDVGAADRD
jgi:hypothetical protein